MLHGHICLRAALNYEHILSLKPLVKRVRGSFPGVKAATPPIRIHGVVLS